MDRIQESESRGYYRLEYPPAERPTMRYKGRDYRVSEASEVGVKILLDRHCAVYAGQFFAGVIRFKDGGIVPVVGVVLRHDKREMVVKFHIAAILTVKGQRWQLSKVTDIDRARGIFTDYRNAGDFIRHIAKTPNM